MAFRRSVVSRRPFVRPPPRSMIWFGSGLNSTTIAASTVNLVGSLNAAAKLLRPFTIVRTRLLIAYSSDQVAGSERPQGVYGRVVVKDQASAIGVTALPDPVVDTDAEWYVYQGVFNQVLLSSAVGFSAPTYTQYVVDSKAQRKVGPNEDSVEMFTQRNAFGSILAIEGRMLIKLH